MNPQGSSEIVFTVLVPNEQVTISYLYYPPLLFTGVNAYTKSDEGMAKIVNAIPTPQPPWPTIWVAGTLMSVGASTVLY